MAKKIKKVETPIDQRETFVSLQKNFADSDLSVEEKLKVLYDLQKADVAIDKIIQLRGELPDEVEALENEVADLKAKVAQETEVIDKFNKSIAANKQNIVDLDEEIAKYQAQLENISNSREFDSINKEIENQGYLSMSSPCAWTTSRPRSRSSRASSSPPPTRRSSWSPSATNAPPRSTPGP